MSIDITGISNENEFYTHHYLAAILENDLKSVFQQWRQREEEENIPQPSSQLRSLRRDYFAMRSSLERVRNPAERLQIQRSFCHDWLQALGYQLHPHCIETDDHCLLPLLGGINRPDGSPEMWILEAVDLHGEDLDPFTLTPIDAQFPEEVEEKQRLAITFEEIITKQVFSRLEPPRWILLISSTQVLLIDRSKWHEKRLLRFDIREILDRRELSTLQATAALLHRESICPAEGTPLLDTLDENSHKHAFAVSEDLKYSLREAIELLGNEAVTYLREVSREKIYGRDMAGQLSSECLRYMYRLLFLFYIEARPELGYLPIESDIYRKGYSLESLRDLELIPLTTEESRNGTYLHQSIATLFDLLYNGFSEPQLNLFGDSLHNTFEMAPLRSHLFDPDGTPLLNKVKFRNFVLQKVLELMSLSRPSSGRNSRRGRISYSQLGINQLGAVYEALLSYQGFFAETDLYEVKRAQDTHNVLETAYFVKAEDLEQYTKDERVYKKDGTLIKYDRGTFIYRLAGRDREKSASYYTPEVLTQCLVKYALKELLKEKTADEILHLTVCEPAMGSAAFLNEAVNQLARAYLDRKQKEMGVSLSHEEYPQELQKVKMYIADNNVYGVDLNPTAVELAEVSLWLNTIYKGAFVPWFGMQLTCGNSLIGARRQVFSSNFLIKGKKTEPFWLDKVPLQVMPGEERGIDSVYHFLLPYKGMADYQDKVIKEIAIQEIKAIDEWRKEFIKPFSKNEIEQLVKLSDAVDRLWRRHAEMQRSIDDRTSDPLQIFGQEKVDEKFRVSTTKDKDRILQQEMFSENVRSSSPYRRLKLVMDYWCALWFWPMEKAELLPSRAEYLFDLMLLLEGNLYDSGVEENGQRPLFPDTRSKQLSLAMLDEFGFVNVDSLFEENERLGLVREIGERYRYIHWELEFADLFERRGGFDLVVGNPPWIRPRLELEKIVAEYDPRIFMRNYSAVDKYKHIITKIDNEDIANDLKNESQDILGSRNFLSSSQFPIALTTKTNLYKCFMERGVSIKNRSGIVALLHDTSIYDETGAQYFRDWMLKRMVFSARFINQLNHFPEEALGHAGQFSISILGNEKEKIDFYCMSNVFHPKTIDESYNSLNCKKKIPKIKNENGWILNGHPDRLVKYNHELYEISKQMFINPEKDLNIPIFPIYAKPLVELIKKSIQVPPLARFENTYKGKAYIDENLGLKSGLIEKITVRPGEICEFILSAPHFYVGNPLFKQPNEGCKSKGDYNSLDLSLISNRFIPRALFKVINNDVFFNIIKSEQNNNDLKRYRFAWRTWVSPTNERTLITTIIPPKMLHIYPVHSMPFSSNKVLIYFYGLTSSIIYDFLIRITGIDHVWDSDIFRLPLPVSINKLLINEINIISLKLVCVTEYYKDLWDEISDSEKWSHGVFFRSYLERRNALVSLDVLAAMSLGMTLNELQLLYTTQFPTLLSNENETYYDKTGRIIFTTNRGYSGVGFPRKASKLDPQGWEDIKDMQSGTVERTILDDTQPGGPVERTITYHAPFYRCDREKDYEVVWAEFERRFAN